MTVLATFPTRLKIFVRNICIRKIKTDFHENKLCAFCEIAQFDLSMFFKIKYLHYLKFELLFYPMKL